MSKSAKNTQFSKLNFLPKLNWFSHLNSSFSLFCCSSARFRVDPKRCENSGAIIRTTRRGRAIRVSIWARSRWDALLDEVVQGKARILSLHAKGESTNPTISRSRNISSGEDIKVFSLLVLFTSAMRKFAYNFHSFWSSLWRKLVVDSHEL